jgi:hypothetical protein
VLELLKENTWPADRIDDDLSFLKRVATAARSAGVYERLKGELEAGCRRIRPDEVVGACTCKRPPPCFEDARVAAERVLEMLHEDAFLEGRNPQ